ncbi:cysO-cysteine peptidase [Mycobacterium kansasii]|uniref:CysO-cysteine peptidase n=1 Tax=Mycobacterium kansasii TaxID=1768 RepID=A0A1V3XLA7_MYCKA|nr:cysO-cysteine peptidase [Mycobacterium kansasii]
MRKGTAEVLVIRADLVDAMLAHARRDHPDEACGLLAGPEGSDRPSAISR